LAEKQSPVVMGLARKAIDKGVSTLLSVDPPVPGAVRDGVAEVFRFAASVRGEPVLHPKGVAFRAVFEVHGGQSWGAPLLERPNRYEAFVRLSKSAGTPGALPDPLGLAIRVRDAGGPGRPFDLLLASTGRSPGLRHVLVPRDNFVAVYTSGLPYRVGRHRRFFAALPAQRDRRIRPSLYSLRAAVEAEPLEFRIAVGSATGAWHPVASLLITGLADVADDQFCFDVCRHVVDGIRPVGALQRMRGPAYRASQQGRSAQCPMGFR
jgi:hypothetical protein